MLNLIARLVAFVGATMIMLRRWDRHDGPPAQGLAPAIPAARPQAIPTLKMPTAEGWKDGQTPVAAPGLKVSAFAKDLIHPRQMLVLDNGDVLVAESLTLKPPAINGAFDYAQVATMVRAGALGDSPNRVTLLRDADGDGVAEIRETLLEGVRQPYGLAFIDGTLYVGCVDGVRAFPYALGETRITAPGRKLTRHEEWGHWTRNLLPSADGKKLYVAVGSLTNIAEQGMAKEKDRAAIHELDLDTGQSRIFASGLRNPVGLAREPQTGLLWTVVNERDGIGDETPPDYLTSVVDGGFYGWPYCYWDRIVDHRVPQDPAMVAKALTPDYALGGHTASLGLCWLPAGTLPGLGDGMAIGQHGSWNRSTLAGYRLIFVPFANGKPQGEPKVLLSGFLSADEKLAHGRPVGVALAKDGSVLMCDDVGDVVWRVTGA